MPPAWLRRNVFHPCEGGPLLRTIYLATLVWPISMPSLRSSPWILGAPHNGLAMLISRICPQVLGLPLWNGTVITWEILIGVGLIALGFAMTAVYVRRANS